MELRQLKYFLTIAESNNVSDAAKKLHVSQPAISTALKDLEKELGFPLFDRTGKRLHINQYGRYFAKKTKTIFAVLEDSQNTIKDEIAKRENTIRCRVNMPLGHMGKVLFQKFHHAFPDISFQIGFSGTTLFDSSSYDLEIFGSVEPLQESATLIKLTHERFLVAIPSNHPLASKHPLYLTDFKNESFILGEPSVMRDTVKSMFEQAGFRPYITGELQLFSDILQLVKAEVGCAIVPEYSWSDFDKDDELVVRSLKDVQRGRTIYAQIPQNIIPSEATKILFSYIQEHKCDFDSKRILKTKY